MNQLRGKSQKNELFKLAAKFINYPSNTSLENLHKAMKKYYVQNAGDELEFDVICNPDRYPPKP